MSSLPNLDCAPVVQWNEQVDLTSPVPEILGSSYQPTGTQVTLIRKVLLDSDIELSNLDGPISRTKSILRELQDRRAEEVDTQLWLLFDRWANPLDLPMRPQSHSKWPIVQPSSISSQHDHENSLRETDAEIRRLDGEIAPHQILFQRLQHRQSLVRNFRDAHSTLLAPIRKLPVEIVTEIFMRCVLKVRDRGPHAKRAPLLLAQVCGLWRKVALFTAKLWSYLKIVLCSRNPDSQAALIKTWLERSSGCALSIIVDHNGYFKRDHNPVIDIIVQYASRWEDVAFNMPRWMYNGLAPAKNRLTSLRQLRVDISLGDDFELEPLDIFKIAPQLSIVVLLGPSTGLELPWSQIVQCVLDGHAVSCQMFVNRASNLQDLKFLSVYTNRPITAIPTIAHHLTSLHLTDSSSSMTSSIFPHLTLPALRDITLNFNASGLYYADFIAFLERSSCAVERLIIMSLTLTYDEFIGCLEALPSLSELELYHVYSSSPFEEVYLSCVNIDLLKRLTYRAENTGAPILLPKLATFKLWVPLPFADQNLVEMIQSRWHQPAPNVSRLKSIGLSYDQELPGETGTLLKRFQDEGLSVHVNGNR